MQKMCPASVIMRFMEDEENAGKYFYNDSDSWLLWIPDL